MPAAFRDSFLGISPIMNKLACTFRKWFFVLTGTLCAVVAYLVFARSTPPHLAGPTKQDPMLPFAILASAMPPLLPRNGHTMACAIVARISGCQNQKEASLDDQIDNGKSIAADLHSGPIDYQIVRTKGKGERLDRPELAVIEAAFRSGKFDLVVLDDLGRLVRGAEAVRLLGIAVDHGTRVISPNDCIDTAESTWEEDALAACRDHVSHNAHCSKRLKQKMMNRFTKRGAAPARPIPGYDVPDDAETYEDWVKRECDTPIIQEAKALLRRTLNCSVTADFFNSRGFAPGPYCTNKEWDGAMVRRFFGNPLLKGMPYRGKKHTVKHHETGRRISVLNPKGPTFYHAPHLAHLSVEEFDELNAALDQKNANFRRRFVNGQDPLFRVARRRTRFPGQIARCYYCGRGYVWGGNGQTTDLMCSGVRCWDCWNGVSFTGQLAANQVVAALITELTGLDKFDQQFLDIFQRTAGQTADLETRRSALNQREADLARQKGNLQQAIAQFGPKPLIADQIAEVERNERNLARERWELQQIEMHAAEQPPTGSELRCLLQDSLRDIALDSTDFTDLMRQLIVRFDVYAVRLLDGGHLLPRAKIRLELDGILPCGVTIPEISNLLVREFTVNLWEPTQREKYLPQIVELSRKGLTSREIAAALPEKVTQPVVLQALELAKLMQERGLDTPYEFISAPPADYKKLRRHKNPRYRFSADEGYEPQPL